MNVIELSLDVYETNINFWKIKIELWFHCKKDFQAYFCFLVQLNLSHGAENVVTMHSFSALVQPAEFTTQCKQTVGISTIHSQSYETNHSENINFAHTFSAGAINMLRTQGWCTENTHDFHFPWNSLSPKYYSEEKLFKVRCSAF